MVVVADTSPLIYLSRVGALGVLHVLFGEVVVPRAVWTEVVDREWPALDLGLDPGETEAILLAESLDADLLLIDERLGRRVAESRGLTVRGTLGVLVQARRAGALPALRPVLESLVADGFRISPALIREALGAVGEIDDTSA